MIKILVFSHLYILKPYRRKFEEIAKRFGDVRLRVVTPTQWLENFQDIVFESQAGMPAPQSDTETLWGRHPCLPTTTGRDACATSRYEGFPCPICFSGYTSRFFYTRGIVTHFRDFKPDIIHFEEEPWSMCALQVLLLKKLFCSKSRLIFRTSLSIWMKQRFFMLPTWIEKLFFKETDMAFPLSDSAGEILRRKGYRGPLKPFPNGVDVQLFRKIDVSELKSQLGLEGKFVIGYAGRLLQMKGLDTLLCAAAKLGGLDYRLFILGRGGYKSNLVALSEKLGISHKLRWMDAVPPEDVPRYINCMDALVLPSLTTPGWVEFFGRVLVEAMACEVPVIGSDSGEIPNVIGDAGLIFHEGDADDLKDKLLLLAHDENLQSELAALGRKRAIEKYSWEQIAADTYEVYKNLMGEG
ncbi:TPA: glycosyltransferase family 1 protein [Candidatus Poribacteria bacterium]|nr:glycosyltransferase family 1 protein [Candidatus Poribacteria bacterium]